MFKYYIYKSFEKEYNHDTHEGFYNISFKNIEEIKKFFDFIKQNVQNKWIYDIATLIIFPIPLIEIFNFSLISSICLIHFSSFGIQYFCNN